MKKMAKKPRKSAKKAVKKSAKKTTKPATKPRKPAKKPTKKSAKKPAKPAKKPRKPAAKTVKSAGASLPMTAGLTEHIKEVSCAYPDFPLFKKMYAEVMNKKHKPFIKLTDIKKQLPYKYNKGQVCKRFGMHIGQRKLLLSEVQFLTKHGSQKYCVYVGSAPGNKTHMLSNLFPDIKFILVDPNIFKLFLTHNNVSHRMEKHPDIVHIYHEYPTESNKYKTNKKLFEMSEKEKDEVIEFIKTSKHKIFIWEDYMTLDLAKFFSSIDGTVFISDIRTKLSDDGGSPGDMDIVWNRSMVHNWINTIRPDMSMVKFRIPYYNELINFEKHKGIYEKDFKESLKYGVDFYNDYNNKVYKMSKATIYLQAWKGGSSTEMRGYIAKKDLTNVVEYDIKKIEDTLFYYNKIIRVMYHANPNADKSIHFCNCNDCAIENSIWTEYMEKYKNMPQDIKYYINMTNRATKRRLKDVHTITVYNPIDEDTLKGLLQQENKSTRYDTTTFQRGNVAPTKK